MKTQPVAHEAKITIRLGDGKIGKARGKKLRAAAETFVQALEEKGARHARVSLKGDDNAQDNLLDPRPIAHRIMDRRTKGLRDLQKQWVKSHRVELFLGLCETLAKTQTVRERFQKLRRSYEKNRGIRLNTTEKGRRAISFLDEYHQLYHLLSELRVRERLLMLRPVVKALDENDSDFFDNVAMAMRYREVCKRDTNIARARKARKEITEAAILQGRKASLTPREAKEKFWPEYNDDLKNFKKVLKECGYEWKRLKRGSRKGKTLGGGTEKKVCESF